MIALTKIGVVLLVIASLLLSAGVVVFVNKSPNYQQALDSLKSDLEKERLKVYDAQQDAYRARADRDAGQADSRAALVNFETTIAGLNTKIDEQAKAIAEQTKEKLKQTALAEVAVNAQKELRAQITAHEATITGLRNDVLTQVKERHAIVSENADLRARNSIMERAVRVAEERANNMRVELIDLRTRIASAPNVKPESLATPTAAAGYLEGVVNTVFDTGGKRWASISIGTKENVAKNMKFAVHNDKDFLGYLIIQVTEPNEAAGVLEGPGVVKVKQGDQVKTQLQ